MINAIERNFAKESSYIDPMSDVLLQQLANNKARRRFNYMLTAKKSRESHGHEEQSSDDELGDNLKDYSDFLWMLSHRPHIQQKLLPNNFPLKYSSHPDTPIFLVM